MMTESRNSTEYAPGTLPENEVHRAGQDGGVEESQKDDVLIDCDGLVKIYKTKETEVLALQGLDLSVERGELTAIIGNSGSGKFASGCSS